MMNTYESSSLNPNVDGHYDLDQLDVHFDLVDHTPDINRPLQRSSKSHRRLRYTCSTVTTSQSPIVELQCQYLALGTTTGSIYVFKRNINCSPLPLSASTSISSSTSSLLTTDNSLSPRFGPRHIRAHFEHHITLIHEDVVGSVSAVKFAQIEVEDSSSEDHQLTHSDNSQSSNNACANRTLQLAKTNQFCLYDNQQTTISKALLAIGTSKGCLMIVEIYSQPCNSAKNYLPFSFLGKETHLSDQWRIVYQCSSFTTNAISQICWDDNQRLFIVDSSGQMFVLYDIDQLNSLMIPSVPTLLFDLNGVEIYQFEICEKLLLMSTVQNKVYLFDLNSSELTQIGKHGQSKKKSRDQANGVCIMCNWKCTEVNHCEPDSYQVNDDVDSIYDETFYDGFSKTYQFTVNDVSLFVTRPKLRLWVVDSEGNVQFTHQFKDVVEQMANTAVSGDSLVVQNIFDSASTQPMPLTNFRKLYPLYWSDPQKSLPEVNHYLVTYSDMPQCRIYVIDPNEQAIVAVSPVIRGQIVDIICVDKNIFVTYFSESESSFCIIELTLILKYLNAQTQLSDLSYSSPLMSQENLSSFESNNLSSDLCENIEINLDVESNSNADCEHIYTDIGVQTLIPTSSEPKATDQCESVLVLRQYISLFADLQDITYSKCSCGLPLPISYDTIEQDFLKIQLNSSISRSMLQQLTDLSLSNANWTLYYYLLGKSKESKLCLYFSILFGDARLITNHHKLFGFDLFSDEQLWIETLEYISYCIFHNQNMHRLTFQLLGKQPPMIFHKGENEEEKINQPDNCCFCKITKWKSSKDYHSIMNWFELNLLNYSLLYCTPTLIMNCLQKIFSLLKQANNETVDNCWLSSKFYMLLFRFQLFNISIVSIDNTYLRTNIVKNRNYPQIQYGTLIDLQTQTCYICKKSLFNTENIFNCRKIRLFRNCAHAYHYDCLFVKHCIQCTHSITQ